MEYKPKYSKEEISKLVDWMDSHMDRFPPEIEIDNCSSSMNPRYTYLSLREIVCSRHNLITFSAYVKMVYDMRDAIAKILGEEVED
ncbi:MAG: hypothetical protein IKX93_06175 [Bacteroidaceae bacterium]|nr:hypothetical protein [Bacteroidaceae bacterium]MBR5764189.1 hypothetical protein [Bacteroidaceae bacterium]